MAKRTSSKKTTIEKNKNVKPVDLDLEVVTYDTDSETNVKVGDTLYFVRFLTMNKTVLLSEMFPVKIRTIYDNCFMCYEETTQMMHVVNKNLYGKRLFRYKIDAEMRKCDLEENFSYVEPKRRYSEEDDE